jgi:hypothetical protein
VTRRRGRPPATLSTEARQRSWPTWRRWDCRSIGSISASRCRCRRGGWNPLRLLSEADRALRHARRQWCEAAAWRYRRLVLASAGGRHVIRRRVVVCGPRLRPHPARPRKEQLNRASRRLVKMPSSTHAHARSFYAALGELMCVQREGTLGETLLDPRALGRILVKPQTARGLTDGGGTKVRISFPDRFFCLILLERWHSSSSITTGELRALRERASLPAQPDLSSARAPPHSPLRPRRDKSIRAIS